MYRGTSPFNQIGMFGKRITKKDWFPSVANLVAPITANSITVNPTSRYALKDGTTSQLPAWTYGQTLPIYNPGSGADVVTGVSTALRGPYDKAVTFSNAGKYYRYSNNSYHEIGAGDLYVEAMAFTGTGAADIYYAMKYNTYGFFFAWTRTTSRLYFYIKDTSGNSLSSTSQTLSNSTWYFFQFCINRSENPNSNGAFVWCNGTKTNAGTATKISAVTTNTDYFRIGPTGANTQSYFALCEQADWFAAGATGAAQMDALAVSRQKLVKWW